MGSTSHASLPSFIPADYSIAPRKACARGTKKVQLLCFLRGRESGPFTASSPEDRNECRLDVPHAGRPLSGLWPTREAGSGRPGLYALREAAITAARLSSIPDRCGVRPGRG